SDEGVKALARGLSGLTSLILSECGQVSDEGVKALAQSLSGLTSLDLTGCRQVSDEGVRALAQSLSGLTSLDLAGCEKISHLPRSFTALLQLRYLRLPDIPSLGLPLELLADPHNPTAILNYYFRGEKEGKRQLNEAKLLVVGNESVGKTSLVNF